MEGPVPLLPPQLTIRTTIPSNSRASGALLRHPGIANTKTPANTPKPNMPVVTARMAPAWGAVVVIVTIAVTGFELVISATTAGQVDSVIDAGRVQAMFTCPVKPPVGVTVTLVVPDCPGAEIVTVVGLTESVKLPVGDVTVRATVVVAVRLPDVPVMVTVVGPPTVAELLAVSVKVLVVVVLDGLNAAVTPLGRPDASSVTLPVKPPEGVTVIVLVPMLPCTMLKLMGTAESVKLGPVPVTVTALMPVAGL